MNLLSRSGVFVTEIFVSPRSIGAVDLHAAVDRDWGGGTAMYSCGRMPLSAAR